jgi:hypothetical protein
VAARQLLPAPADAECVLSRPEIHTEETEMDKRIALAVLLAAGPGITACDDSTAGGAGRVTVQLTDAPFPFSEVSRVDVFVVRVDAKTTVTDSADAANAGNMSGWTTLASPNVAINLMDLNGGKLTTLGTATLPNGTYQGFRVVIDPAQSSVMLKDGAKPDIKWPSASRSGIKVNLTTPLVVSSDSSVFIIDFDIGRSFVMRGNSIRNNGLLFKPVVHAVAQDITGSVSGSVRGDSATGAAIAGATVELLKAGTALDDTVSANVVRTTFTDANGNFTFGFVLPATYVVRATPPTGSVYKPALLAGGITLANSQTLTGTVIVLPR